MNEERDMEKLALQSIFPEEYSEISESKIIIKVKPDHQQNQNFAINFIITYFDNYPETLPEIDIVPNERWHIAEEDLQNIKEYLQNEAKKRLGIVMVFELIELLRPELAQLVTELAKGDFVLLSRDMWLEIFFHLDLLNLGRVLQTSKEMYTMLSDESLWKYHFTKQFPLKKLPHGTTWKNFAIQTQKETNKKQLKTPKSKYTLSILERHFTGREWTTKPWQFAFKEELTNTGFNCISEKIYDKYESGIIKYTSASLLQGTITIGKYSLLSYKYAIKRSLWASNFHQGYNPGPYAGNILGFLCFDLENIPQARQFIKQAIITGCGQLMKLEQNKPILYYPLSEREIQLKTVYSKKKRSFISIQLAPEFVNSCALLGPLYTTSTNQNIYSDHILIKLERYQQQNKIFGYNTYSFKYWCIDLKLPDWE